MHPASRAPQQTRALQWSETDSERDLARSVQTGAGGEEDRRCGQRSGRRPPVGRKVGAGLSEVEPESAPQVDQSSAVGGAPRQCQVQKPATDRFLRQVGSSQGLFRDLYFYI